MYSVNKYLKTCQFEILKKLIVQKNNFHVCIFAAYMHAYAYNLVNFRSESLALILRIVCICRHKLQQFMQTFLQMATPLK
jgi:hypothetical protein